METILTSRLQSRKQKGPSFPLPYSETLMTCIPRSAAQIVLFAHFYAVHRDHARSVCETGDIVPMHGK